MELSIVSPVGFSSMHVNIKLVSHFNLGLHDLLEEVVNLWIVILLIDHVKASDDVGLRISVNHCVNLRLNMPCAKHFESADDQPHAEEREPELDLFDAVFKDGQLLFETKHVTVVIKNATHNMAVLNDSDHLLHEVTSCSVKDALEERLVVVQREGQLELGLEACPYLVVFEIISSR